MLNKPSRGEVWLVNLDPTIGHEQAKLRPCLVISNNELNHGPSHLHIVLPITSKNRENPLHVKIQSPEGGVDKESFILCDQIRTVSRKRFKSKGLGSVTQLTLRAIEHILAILINI